ncbi:IS481 family transposase [Ornithinimicrobium sp. INDO-MA30-4]|uniref:IS481 family transposase n=1 Tax=Ornithinimicrobium sp. INDO-MA30-4 TaxID=2908651 RepID=UPI001F3F0B0D|nr:IS481 family transposase [Ornithinimicrobium sp. INDO-MA30-4]UJH71125.1 IS481 family transposase [Ornithinimicrobium sp. INDO-MA30-4]
MSKARLVIAALPTEHLTPTEVAPKYGVHRSWVYRLKARYDTIGEAAFEPQSRRPHHTPNTTDPETTALVLDIRNTLTQQGHDAGADTIRWHLHPEHHTLISRATIHRILARNGLITPTPKKRPKSSYLRFEAEQPNETWQSDFTHYMLPNSKDIKIITWLDDHSRYALHISAHHRITATTVVTTFTKAAGQHGYPASTLTDNGMVYTARFAGGRGGKSTFEIELRTRGITQKNGKPNHPTTQGKVERFQQTLKKWLRAQHPQPENITQLQRLINQFRHEYNETRPHRSLPHHATPTAAYTARPKATPGNRSTETHHRVRDDRVSKTGSVTLRYNSKLHHIGIGRTYAGTYVRLLIQDLNITIINTITGEILRELTLDPTKNYQPKPPPKTTTDLRFRRSVVADVLRHHTVGLTGFEPAAP